MKKSILTLAITLGLGALTFAQTNTEISLKEAIVVEQMESSLGTTYIVKDLLSNELLECLPSQARYVIGELAAYRRVGRNPQTGKAIQTSTRKGENVATWNIESETFKSDTWGSGDNIPQFEAEEHRNLCRIAAK